MFRIALVLVLEALIYIEFEKCSTRYLIASTLCACETFDPIITCTIQIVNLKLPTLNLTPQVREVFAARAASAAEYKSRLGEALVFEELQYALDIRRFDLHAVRLMHPRVCVCVCVCVWQTGLSGNFSRQSILPWRCTVLI